MESTEVLQRGGRRVWALVALITVVAAGLRAWDIGRQSFWVDELLSMETSSAYGFEAHWTLPVDAVAPAPDFIGLDAARPWWSIPTAMNRDVHPPLYFVMLRGWREVFGSSEAAARSLAAVFGVLGVPLLFVLGRDLLGTTAALWACAIYAVAGPQVQLAQEVRGYVPLVTITLAAAVVCVRIERRGGSVLRYALLASCVLAMLLTHYFSVGPILGIALYVLVRFRGAMRWGTIGTIAAGAAVYAVLWGPMLVQQFTSLGNVHDWVVEDRAGHLGRTLARVAVLPVTYLNEPMGTSFALAAVGVVAYVLPLVLLRRRPGLLLPWLLLVCGVGFVMTLDLMRAAGQLMYVRYTLAAAPAAHLLFAGVASNLRGIRHLLPAAAVVSCLVSLPRAYTYHTPPKPDWRTFAAEITRDGPVDTVVILGPRGDSWLTSNYLGLHYYLHPKPKYVVAIDDTTSDETRRHLRAAPNVWAISMLEKQRPIPSGFEVERTAILPRTASAMKLRPVEK